jgi:hypothetical protein
MAVLINIRWLWAQRVWICARSWPVPLNLTRWRCRSFKSAAADLHVVAGQAPVFYILRQLRPRDRLRLSASGAATLVRRARPFGFESSVLQGRDNNLRVRRFFLRLDSENRHIDRRLFFPPGGAGFGAVAVNFPMRVDFTPDKAIFNVRRPARSRRLQCEYFSRFA